MILYGLLYTSQIFRKKKQKKRAPGERKESVNALRANDKVILYLC